MSIDTIKANNFNLDIKNPHKAETQEELTTDEILDKLLSSFSKSKTLVEELKGELVK